MSDLPWFTSFRMSDIAPIVQSLFRSNRPPGCRTVSSPRWLPAGRSPSNRRRGANCSNACAGPDAWRLRPARRRRSPAVRARFATAAAGPAMPATAATSSQICGRELHARRIQQPVGAADCDGKTVGKGEQPLRRAVDDAGHRRQTRRRRDAEMGVDDGAKLARHRQVRNERGRHHRRHRQNDGIARRRAALFRRRNRAPSRGSPRTSMPRKRWPKMTAPPFASM